MSVEGSMLIVVRGEVPAKIIYRRDGDMVIVHHRMDHQMAVGGTPELQIILDTDTRKGEWRRAVYRLHNLPPPM